MAQSRPMGALVYATGRTSTIHADRRCGGLKGNTIMVMEWDAGMLDKPRLCKICFPMYKIASRHVRCCGTIVRACEHNGGVLVKISNRLTWVWPEDAHRHTLVNPVSLD